MSTPSIEITLDRIDRIYHPGDKVTGAILIDSKSSLSYSSLRLQIEGGIQLQLSARSIGLFEAFYSSLKPIQLINLDTEIASGGKLQAGITEFPFEFELKSTNPSEELYETYHGVYININYQINADFNRGLMAKNIKKSKEFYVEQHANKEIRKKEEKAKPFLFKIAPESLQNVKESSKKKIPEFAFEGDLSHLNCLIDEPMVGNLLIKKCAVDIKSIELQLVRVEVIKYMEGEAREATEIQNIQIAEGNICRGLSIPLFMIFPRLFTCSSIKTNNFQIEFEVNLIVLFADNHMVTENFPIKLYR